jgi:hypothetical protein
MKNHYELFIANGGGLQIPAPVFVFGNEKEMGKSEQYRKKGDNMKTSFFDATKRKLLLAGAISFASLKLGKLGGIAHAKDRKEKTDSSPEARLEAKIAEYDLQIQRLQAISAIQNCMGRYETYHLVGSEVGKTPECYALWRDDVTVEVSDGGVVYGAESVKNYWLNFTSMDPGNTSIFYHTLATPCIQVAGDGKTAKATWWSPGFETGCGGGERSNLDLWCWGKYACDFIKNPETGDWKIWHSHWFRTTRNDYHLSFTEFAQKNAEEVKVKTGETSSGMGELPKLPGDVGKRPVNTKPTVFFNTFSCEHGHHPFPIDPDPYETYNGDFRWPYGGEEREKRHGVKYTNLEKIYNADYPNNI